MITVKAYVYPNTAEVQVFDPSIFTVRNRVVYSRPIKVYQGVDNPIQVLFRNQDQKFVNLTGYTVSAQIQDPTNQTTVNSYAVTFADITTGMGTFVLDATHINTLENRFYKLTFLLTNTGSGAVSPLYIDDNYGATLDLEVLPGYYSNYSPSPEFNYDVIDGGIL